MMFQKEQWSIHHKSMARSERVLAEHIDATV